MLTTYIIGKRSYLSANLKKNIEKSKILSVRDILNLKSVISNKKKINIIYNHSYPLSKINECRDYCNIVYQNVVILNNLFKFFLKKKIKINKFIFSSSSAVNSLEKNSINFDSFDNNRKLYGVSKFLIETFLVSQKKNFKFELIIARIFNIYGLGEKVSIISKIINLRNKNKKISNFTNQKSYRDFIHISDVVKIYKIFLNKKNISGQYDIGTGIATDIRKLINSFFNKNQQIYFKSRKFSEVKYSKADITNLKKVVGNILFINLNKFIIDSLIK